MLYYNMPFGFCQWRLRKSHKEKARLNLFTAQSGNIIIRFVFGGHLGLTNEFVLFTFAQKCLKMPVLRWFPDAPIGHYHSGIGSTVPEFCLHRILLFHIFPSTSTDNALPFLLLFPYHSDASSISRIRFS